MYTEQDKKKYGYWLYNHTNEKNEKVYLEGLDVCENDGDVSER
jgi:hypothetical protein